MVTKNPEPSTCQGLGADEMPFRLRSPQYLELAASLSLEACLGTGYSI
jgi:hypothetical protein